MLIDFFVSQWKHTLMIAHSLNVDTVVSFSVHKCRFTFTWGNYLHVGTINTPYHIWETGHIIKGTFRTFLVILCRPLNEVISLGQKCISNILNYSAYGAFIITQSISDNLHKGTAGKIPQGYHYLLFHCQRRLLVRPSF